MKRMHRSKSAPLLIVAAMAIPVSLVQGADKAKKKDDKPTETLIERASGESRGRLRLKGRASFLMRGSFGGLGSFPTQTATLVAPVGAATPAATGVAAGTVLGPGATTLTPGNRFYDDGYVAMDGTGLADGLTKNWSNVSVSQLAGGGSSVNMNSSTVIPDGAVNGVDSDISPGAELSYLYKIRDTKNGSWGFLAGMGYSFVNVEDNTVALATELRRTDNYATGPGVIVAGTYAGAPGVIPGESVSRISQTPASVTIAPIVGGATVGGLREIEANIFDFQLGPYVDFDLGKGATLSLSAGGVGAFIDSEFTVNETTTVTALAASGTTPYASSFQNTSASSSDTGFVYGAFAGLELGVQITPRTSIFAGAEYRYMDDFDQTLGSRRATLHLDRALNANLGLSFSF